MYDYTLPNGRASTNFLEVFSILQIFFWKFFQICKITSEQKETIGQFHKRYMPTLKCKMLAFLMPNVIILNFQFFEIVLAFIVSCRGVTQLGSCTGLVTVGPTKLKMPKMAFKFYAIDPRYSITLLGIL